MNAEMHKRAEDFVEALEQYLRVRDAGLPNRSVLNTVRGFLVQATKRLIEDPPKPSGRASGL